MGRYFTGSLQEGIAFAVSEGKAVVCFVRDDAEASSTWDKEYFDGDEFESLLFTKAVPLCLTAGSTEAGFLTSFCPIVKFPTVVVIKNGTLAEYLVPEISKDEFQSRLKAALTKENEPNEALPAQNAAASGVQSDAAVAAPVPPPTAAVTSQTSHNQTTVHTPAPSPQQEQRSTQGSAPPKKAASTQSQKKAVPPKPQPSKPEQTKPASKPKTSDKMAGSISQKAVPASHKEAEPVPKAPKPRGPPTQYRLQVRLFDGSSLRASFTPTQKISTDVRPWLDAEMGDEQRPYNLKHILTPLPSRTLSVAEESQTLRDLGLGSTANLVMVPVASYTDAYAAAGSLPVRGASAVFSAVSSVATTATGYLGSWIGYGTGATQQTEGSSSDSTPAASVNRTRLAGPNIRTLSDQQDDRGDRQFYNGNQLNFEPRQRKDD